MIILAAFWGLLVLFLCVVLLNTFRVLESTKMMIDATREETVPLLREVRGSVERTNREIDRIDGILQRVESAALGLIEQAAASPLVKIISVGAGLRKGASRFKKRKPRRHPRAKGQACSVGGSGSRSGWARGRPAPCSRPVGPGSRPQRVAPATLAREAKGGFLDLGKLVSESIAEGVRRWRSANASSAPGCRRRPRRMSRPPRSRR